MSSYLNGCIYRMRLLISSNRIGSRCFCSNRSPSNPPKSDRQSLPLEKNPTEPIQQKLTDTDAHLGMSSLGIPGNFGDKANSDKDPHMYTKFIVKYGTAVVLFLSAMSILNWYEKQIKMEREQKKINPPPPPPNISPFAARPLPRPPIPEPAGNSAQNMISSSNFDAVSNKQVDLKSGEENLGTAVSVGSDESVKSSGELWHMFVESKDDESEDQLDRIEELLLDQTTLEARLKKLRRLKRNS
eukprot:CAMPEP_0182443802 /NCGR_PEP_ID=MMETSP1172-20130603/2434_1 /TAXON_ID=708627 /ORGANISM="Timspurckia oligopyrenoides, Strain CCMP3278" /LENGTH=242 /DNA_ID=CAMNT_0024639181 /DNA_START=29 /DNA_END=754 /DNA_ORIENTATION=+